MLLMLKLFISICQKYILDMHQILNFTLGMGVTLMIPFDSQNLNKKFKDYISVLEVKSNMF